MVLGMHFEKTFVKSIGGVLRGSNNFYRLVRSYILPYKTGFIIGSGFRTIGRQKFELRLHRSFVHFNYFLLMYLRILHSIPNPNISLLSFGLAS
uniref:Uncharacterized protein n=1 Tax=Romanomermis culicivorax TaxID=13658 RepID=A0A915ITM6_ROMCU